MITDWTLFWFTYSVAITIPLIALAWWFRPYRDRVVAMFLRRETKDKDVKACIDVKDPSNS